MATSVLILGRVLIASVETDSTDGELLDLQSRLVEQAGSRRARAVIIDVTSMDVLDSFSSRMLRDTAQMVALRGAVAVIVGIQPAVAFAMVQLGLTLEGLHTALDLEGGLALLGIEMPAGGL
ncbi:MAG: rsbT antagonist protein RsbS [Actinomycetota bacterium]|jgi:rsbT antagonist protein RsbS|nr:rsbT antagonist protein RsbS [Actinomycetota bacterium]